MHLTWPPFQHIGTCPTTRCSHAPRHMPMHMPARHAALRERVHPTPPPACLQRAEAEQRRGVARASAAAVGRRRRRLVVEVAVQQLQRPAVVPVLQRGLHAHQLRRRQRCPLVRKRLERGVHLGRRNARALQCVQRAVHKHMPQSAQSQSRSAVCHAVTAATWRTAYHTQGRGGGLASGEGRCGWGPQDKCPVHLVGCLRKLPGHLPEHLPTANRPAARPAAAAWPGTPRGRAAPAARRAAAAAAASAAPHHHWPRPRTRARPGRMRQTWPRRQPPPPPRRPRQRRPRPGPAAWRARRWPRTA